MKIRFVSTFVVLLCLSMPLLASAQQPVDEMQQARADAERDVERYVSLPAWGAVGFGCGCFGVAYAYLATPEIPAGILLGKTPTYVDTYTRVYREHTKRRRLQAAVIGCGIGSAVSTLSYYLFVFPQVD